jgi:hypothetical protein
MSKFYVGQRVRIVRADVNPHLIGTEARIIGPYRKGRNKTLPAWYGWPLDVRGSSGNQIVAEEWKIEPLQPERNQTIAWSECVWKPEHMRAEA